MKTEFPLKGWGYTIKRVGVGKDFVVCDDHNGNKLYPFTKQALTWKQTKQEIERITGADLRTINMTLSEIIIDEAENGEKKTPPTTTEERSPENLTPDVIAKAQKILNQGLTFQFFLDTAHMIHAGDNNILLSEWISALSSHLTETKINTWQIGSSGKGKSHSKYTITELLPTELYEIFTSASPLSLFYYVQQYGEDALDKTLLFIDEVEATKNALPMLRSLTSQTEITPRHLSVHESTLIDIKIKGARAVWFTSVKAFGSDQIKNRFINLNPDETEEQDVNVFKLQDRRYRQEKKINIDKIEICKALSRIIIQETEKLQVKIPYEIKWAYKERRYLYPFFLAFIKIIAKINFKQRKIEDNHIVAKVEDFEVAKKLWSTSEKTIARRVGKNALTILECLSEDMEIAKTHAELAEETGKSTRQIERVCEELLDEGLVNREKRQKERGRPSWEYWKSKPQTIEDVQIVTGDVVREILGFYDISDMGFGGGGSPQKGGVGKDVKNSVIPGSESIPFLRFTPYDGGSLNPEMCCVCHSKLATWKGIDEDGENDVYGCDRCVKAYVESYR